MNNGIRAIQLDLDTLVDDDGHYDRGDLEDHIVSNVVEIGANTVYLQSFIETDGSNGNGYKQKAYTLFFKTPPSLGARTADGTLMSDAISIIKRHVPQCKVLAWAPTLNCAWLTEKHPGNEIRTAPQAWNEGNRGWYCRATPFSKITHDLLVSMYRALGQVSSQLDGILFQDDMYMTNWEDVSRPGKALLRQLYHLDVRNNNALYEFLDADDNPQNIEWQHYKTRCLNELSKALFVAFRDGYQSAFPEQYKRRQADSNARLLCARDLYASTIEAADTESGEWYAQDLNLSLDLYDQVVVMTYYNEAKIENANLGEGVQWVRGTAAGAVDVANRDGMMRSDKLVMKLQSVRWEDDSAPISKKMLLAQARALKAEGIRNIAFYPALEGDAKFDLNTI